MRRLFQRLLLALSLSPALYAASPSGPVGAAPQAADYDAELRLSAGRVDVDAMTKRLTELGVTDYYWLIWHAVTDWDDLKLFLPKAAQTGIRVWVYLVPPSEGPRNGYPASEPFKQDYERWAEEIARLSLAHPNLVGWLIDDFYANHDFFTPTLLHQMRVRAKSLNPRLLFYPLLYFPEVTPQVLNAYRDVIDGAVVAYPQDRDEIAVARRVLNGQPMVNRAELSCPWHTPTQSGDFVSAAIPVRIATANHPRLRFQERDDFNGPTAGYHFKQVLLDSNVVWEADVAGGTNSWQPVDLELTGLGPEAGNHSHVLEFRLLDKKGVSNFGVRWSLRQLQVGGLEPAATLEQPQAWTVNKRGPLDAGFGAALLRPKSEFHIPFVVMSAASPEEFKLRHGEPASPQRIAQWLRMCLEARHDGICDGVATYCLDKQAKSNVFPMARDLFREFQRDNKPQ